MDLPPKVMILMEKNQQLIYPYSEKVKEVEPTEKQPILHN
jgi:hypothetical protein